MVAERHRCGISTRCRNKGGCRTVGDEAPVRRTPILEQFCMQRDKTANDATHRHGRRSMLSWHDERESE
eukprot:2117782-Pyramimonas_sp.AAC.1